MIQSIDPMKLYSQLTPQAWNQWLTDCQNKNDINQLIDVKRRLQKGMGELAKKKLQTREIACTFIRWCKSIDDTVKKIQRKRGWNPCDDPLQAMHNLEHQHLKKKRDQDLERFLKKESF